MFPAVKKKWVNLFKNGIIMITTRETTEWKYRNPWGTWKNERRSSKWRLNKKWPAQMLFLYIPPKHSFLHKLFAHLVVHICLLLLVKMTIIITTECVWLKGFTSRHYRVAERNLMKANDHPPFMIWALAFVSLSQSRAFLYLCMSIRCLLITLNARAHNCWSL